LDAASSLRLFSWWVDIWASHVLFGWRL